MEQANKLALQQEELGKQISKLLTNFKKDSKSRKTEAYVASRLEDLESHWQLIKGNDELLQGCEVPQHNYFKTNYFTQLKNIYTELKTALQQVKVTVVSTDPDEKTSSGSTNKPEREQISEQNIRIENQERSIQQFRRTLSQVRKELEEDRTCVRFELLLEKIKEQWANIYRVNEEIWVHRKEGASEYSETEVMPNLENQYEEAVEKLRIKIGNLKNTPVAKNLNVTLPKITIPIFEGNYENWSTFSDLFVKLIHENNTLSNTEKMQYLKTHVRGDPSRLIQHLQINEVNYQAAWDLLEKRYKNTRLVLSKLVDKILELPTLHYASADKLRMIHDTTTECLQAIENLEIDTTSWGPLVSRIIARKWDPETNKLYEQSLNKPHEVQEFSAFMNFLEARFHSLETLTDNRRNVNTTDFNGSPRNQNAQVSNNEECRYCKQPHPIFLCNKFKSMTPSGRLQFVEEKNLCKNCLTHSATQRCASTRSCRICNRQHHTLVHLEQKQHVKSKNTSNKQEPSRSTIVSSHLRTQNQSVLITTALVQAITSFGTRELLRVLIDPGSQASFITQQAAELLALPKQKVRAEITGLGDASPTISNWKIQTQITPRFASKFMMNVNLLILPKLTEALPQESFEVDFQEWNNVILADPTFNRSGPIDIVLGAKEYGQILTQGLQKSERGLIAQNTEIGWILSGRYHNSANKKIQIQSLVTHAKDEAKLRKDDSKFMNDEHIELDRDHNMEKVDDNKTDDASYYISHQPVIKGSISKIERQRHVLSDASRNEFKKLLETHWAPSKDTFRFKVQTSDLEQFAKSQILSEVAIDRPIIMQMLKVFSELGLCASIFAQPTLDKAENVRDIVSRKLIPTIQPEDIFGAKHQDKSTTVTLCLEIRPNGPNQRPFQICESESKGSITQALFQNYSAPTYKEVKSIATFIFTTAPYSEGIWEAMVKPSHKRIIGDATLAYGFDRLLYQMGTCFNPGTLTKNNAMEVLTLTPSHIGREIVALHDVTSIRSKPTNSDIFSRRRSAQIPKDNLQMDDVGLMEEEINPSRWPPETYSDKDGLGYIASLRKGGREERRSANNIVPLPRKETKEEEVGPQKKNVNLVTTRRKTAKSSQRSNWWSLAVILFVSTSVGALSKFSIHHPPPGMYVEHVGQARIERGTFRMDLSFDREKLSEDVATASNMTEQMNEFCNNIKTLSDETPCSGFIAHLRELEKEMQFIYNSISSLVKRQKRGLLGQLLTSVFGVNDEVYKDIEELDKNQQELISASNHQTKFMLSAISALNATETRINNQIQHFQDKLNEGIGLIDQMSRWYNKVDENKLSIHFLITYETAKNFITEIIHRYSRLVDVQINRATFYELVKHHQVDQVISSSSKKLPSNIGILPFPLLYTKIKVTTDHIFVFGYFPIVEKPEFLLLKVTPIPLQVANDSYWIMDLTSDIIAVEYNTQLYFQLSDKELQESLIIGEDSYLCSPSAVRNIENNENCIIDEIYQRTEKNTCRNKKVKIGTIVWKQLYKANTWLYITNRPTKVALICNGIREDISLNNTGIVEISQECVIKTRQNILAPKKSTNIRLVEGFTKHVAVKINASWHRQHHHDVERLGEEPIVGLSEELGRIKTQEGDLQHELDDVTWKQISHHSTIISSVSGLGMMGMVVLLWGTCQMISWLKKRHSNQRRVPPETEMVELQPIVHPV